MQFISSNTPTLVMLSLQVGVYAMQNGGLVTPDQAMALMATIATLGVAGAHRMEKPGR